MKHRGCSWAMAPKANDQKGFSLLELMIALAVLAIGLLGYISLHVNSIQGNADASSRTNAGFASQALIDYFQMTGYDNITSASSYTQITTANYDAVYELVPSGYTVSYMTDDIDLNADGTDDALEITVKVTDAQGDTKSTISFICAKDV